jgi:hypothetical protein
MFGGPSGAEGTMQFQIQGGSLDGLIQNMIIFLNARNCAVWAQTPCGGTLAGGRLGEVAGMGMSNDGLFTQTECWSINGYAALNFSGTHTDGSYTAPSNILFRQCPNTNNPERNTVLFDYNANILVGTGWSATSAQASTSGGLYLTSSGGTTTPTNPGDLNIFYTRGTQQGFSIKPSADSGGTAAINFENAAGTQVGSITTTAGATAYNTTSDRRLKEHIVDTGDVGSLIDRLHVVDYNYKADPSTKYTGFIAQDEYEIFPAAVTPGNDIEPGQDGFEAWARDDSKLVPLLVKEIQSLRHRVEQLEHHN